ncbi:MAG: hypothetical protein ABF569_10375, partial [Acetobacter sp.]|uniref:hypothetical protein n=1 Tax=Acetobacter sp. TaxID=440 RepID=UPI0039EC6DC7
LVGSEMCIRPRRRGWRRQNARLNGRPGGWRRAVAFAHPGDQPPYAKNVQEKNNNKSASYNSSTDLQIIPLSFLLLLFKLICHVSSSLS